MASGEQQLAYAVYEIEIHSRDIRAIEHVPIIGQIAEAWINLFAGERIWNNTTITVEVPFDPNVTYTSDTEPTITPDSRRYTQTIVHAPQIYN